MMLRRCALAVLVMGALLFLPGRSATAVDTPLVISTSSVDFGDVVRASTSPTVEVTVTNSGASAFGPIHVFGAAAESPFSSATTCGGQTLPPDGACTISYTFSPSVHGPAGTSSVFTLSDTASAGDGETFTVSLAGTATPQIALSHTEIRFAPIEWGQVSEILTVTATNVGTVPIGPLLFSGGAGYSYWLSEHCTLRTLSPGGTCSLDYQFSPNDTGVFRETSTFSFTGPGLPAGWTQFSLPVCGVSLPSFEDCDQPATTTTTTTTTTTAPATTSTTTSTPTTSTSTTTTTTAPTTTSTTSTSTTTTTTTAPATTSTSTTTTTTAPATTTTTTSIPDPTIPDTTSTTTTTTSTPDTTTPDTTTPDTSTPETTTTAPDTTSTTEPLGGTTTSAASGSTSTVPRAEDPDPGTSVPAPAPGARPPASTSTPPPTGVAAQGGTRPNVQAPGAERGALARTGSSTELVGLASGLLAAGVIMSGTARASNRRRLG